MCVCLSVWQDCTPTSSYPGDNNDDDDVDDDDGDDDVDNSK